MLKILLEQLYKTLKEEKNNDRRSKTGCFDFFEENILNQERFKNYENVKVTAKTVKNYYEKYVEGKKNNSKEPKINLRNLISEYIGYKDYNDFEERNPTQKVIFTVQPKPKIEPKKLQAEEPEFFQLAAEELKSEGSQPERTEPEKPKPFSPKYWIIIIGFCSIPLLGLLFFMHTLSKTNKSTCIIWAGKNYEKTACSTHKAIDNTDLHINIELFKKIEVNKETEFFIKGEAVIWFGKNNEGVIEYFTTRGKHPETGKELDKITRYFLNKHNLLNE